MNNLYKTVTMLGAVSLGLVLHGCTRDIDTDKLAGYPDISEVFFDGFASDMQFQAWGKVTNFHIDNDVKYEGTSSMRIEIPGPDDPLGNWAGGNFYSTSGRNLSGYDALVFYAKSSIATTLEAGFGNDGASSDYLVDLTGIKLNTNWQQVIIPIPNSDKLTSEKGLFFYSAGQVNDQGYSIWIDNVEFVRLGTIAHATITDADKVGFPGYFSAGELEETFNLPNGVNQKMTVSSKYFDFESSDPEVVKVDGDSIKVLKPGNAVLTTRYAEGQINMFCYDYAASPVRSESEVMSLYSDSYTTRIPANWHPGWQYSTSKFNDIDTGTGHVGEYTGLNFDAIVFDSKTDCSEMNYLHIDLLVIDNVTSSSQFKVEIHNGANNPAYIFTQSSSPALMKGSWIPLDLSLDALNGDKNIIQLVLGCQDISHILVDNIYFYK